MNIPIPKCHADKALSKFLPNIVLHEQHEVKLNYTCTLGPINIRSKYSNTTNYLANTVFDKATQKNLEYHDLIKNPKYQKVWSISAANEFGRLAQGMGNQIPKGTDTLHFISYSKVPQNKNPIYA
eukprot:1659756-Ditylum_brightwellii.AAC.1